MIAGARMSTLGTMMLRAGFLSEGQVNDAKEHAEVKQLSEVEAILELGLADEDTLVAFMASKLMVPRVRWSVLERLDPTTIQRLSGWAGWTHQAVPVSADDAGNLTVAFADPTELEAVEAITEESGAYLVRAVASASDIRRALERYYGPRDQVQRPQPRPAPTPAAAPAPAPAPPAPAPAPPAPAAAPSEVPTQPAMSAVNYEQAPPGVQNPVEAPAPAPSPAAAPYMMAGSAPVTHDDDATEQAPVSEQAQPQAGAYPQGTYPQEAHDPHSATTMIDTSAPVHAQEAEPAPRGPRRGQRERMLTPWNPPLSSDQTGEIPRPASNPAPETPTTPAAPPSQPSSEPAAIPPSTGDPVPLSPEAFALVLPKIDEANDRDTITTVLLDFLGAGFSRVILFVHSHNELRGLDARGKDLLVEAVRQVRIPTSGESMFSQVIEAGAPKFGPMRSASKIDQAFAQALGGVKGNVLLLPVKLGSKVPLLLWAHGTSHPVDPHSINELTAAVSKAIHRIISAARNR